MKINWYPGHMAKTRRLMIDDMKNVDIVCEIVDARIPVSSRNPDLADIIKDKPLMILLNKCDMADPAETAKWTDFYKKQGGKYRPVSYVLLAFPLLPPPRRCLWRRWVRSCSGSAFSARLT